MSETIKGTVLIPFSMKGERYDEGDSVEIPVSVANRYLKLGYIETTKKAEKEVEAFEKQELPEVQEKNAKAGPRGKK